MTEYHSKRHKNQTAISIYRCDPGAHLRKIFSLPVVHEGFLLLLTNARCLNHFLHLVYMGGLEAEPEGQALIANASFLAPQFLLHSGHSVSFFFWINFKVMWNLLNKWKFLLENNGAALESQHLGGWCRKSVVSLRPAKTLSQKQKHRTNQPPNK